MRKQVIKFLEDQSEYMNGRVFSFPVPAEVGYPYAVLALEKMVPDGERLGDDALYIWTWQLAIHDARISDAEKAGAEMMARVNRPGQKFDFDDYYIHSIRMDEMSETIMQEDADSSEVVSGVLIKFTIIEERVLS